MTLRCVSKQLYSLSVGGHVNSNKRTSPIEISAEIARQLNLDGDNKLPHTAVLTIELPDGWWHFTVNEYAPGSYDYWIPETREQEQRFLGKIKAIA